MEISTDGGATYKNTGYVSSSGTIYSDASIAAINSTVDFPFGAGQTNGTSSNFNFWMNDVNNGNIPTINGTGWSTVSNPAHPGGGTQNFGGYTTNTNINAFRIGFNTGNINTITVSLYGVVT
jgi:hypothetical protein